MAEWVKYRVDLRLVGRMTQIPDSQKIFGALMHRYAEYTSGDKTAAFVAAVKESSYGFMLSNLMPKGYLPMPQTYVLSRLMSTFKEPNKSFYKLLKKRLFAPIEQMKQIVSRPGSLPDPYIEVEQTQQIHAAIDSKRYNIPALDPNLYSVPEVVVREVAASTDEKKPEARTRLIQDFSFYIGLEKRSEHDIMIEMLHHAKTSGRAFVLGARSSQGLNTFEIVDIHAETYESSVGKGFYLNLGMMLPRNIDFSKSSLKLFTSERRPFNPKLGWNESMKGHFISFIDSGSVVYVNDTIETAGGCVTSPFHQKEIVFGRAYLHPLAGLEAVK
ncbi:hypothetical protein U9M73_16925 [Paenibacillus phoenicis]|uniref:Uncharacterized protein n=1 Tax=Paenibacillus phoenicis TaxID=554117 RepID=A0ABU5PNW7_9BACL|nr:hypothetical protein [Paenibacillus phoenicis]MEA3571635.1 hypothetical protein [Paenibacillus phoenicis]